MTRIASEMTESAEGYAVPPGQYTVSKENGPRYLLTLGLWGLLLMVGMLILSLVDSRVTDVPSRYICPPDCGRPPTGLPVATNPRFTADDGSFSVSYPTPNAAYDVTMQSNGVTANWTAGDGGTLRLFSQPANGRNAEQIAKELLQDGFPDARVVYQLPNATVGYHAGYGEVADFQPIGGSNIADRLRVLVVVAVKNDLALVAAADGPFREFTPEFGPGPPSPANLQIAQDMGKYVNSFSWRGDPPR
ncbi:MAG: hypothetical protein ACR2JM_12905 [Mycobacterium sp.]